MIKINEYTFSENINKDFLIKAGFINNHPNFLYYKKSLFKSLALNIIIPIASDGTLGIEFSIIRVMDEYTFGPYSSIGKTEPNASEFTLYINDEETSLIGFLYSTKVARLFFPTLQSGTYTITFTYLSGSYGVGKGDFVTGVEV